MLLYSDTVLDGSNIVVVLAKPPNKDSHSNKTPKVVIIYLIIYFIKYLLYYLFTL